MDFSFSAQSMNYVQSRAFVYVCMLGILSMNACHMSHASTVLQATIVFLGVCGHTHVTRFPHVRLHTMFSKCSFNTTTLQPYVYPQPVYVYEKCYGCDYMSWADEADKSIYPHTSPHMIYVLPETIDCNWAGMGYVGCLNTSSCRIWIHGMYSDFEDTYFHELGHNMGLTHATSIDSVSKTIQPYGDDTCAMGSCCATRCYNAPHQEQLGWSKPRHVIHVTPTTSRRSTVYTIPSARSTKNSCIRIEFPYAWVYVDFRTGAESNVDRDIIDAVNIYSTAIGNMMGATTILETRLRAVGDTWSKHNVRVTLIHMLQHKVASVRIDIS